MTVMELMGIRDVLMGRELGRPGIRGLAHFKCPVRTIRIQTRS
jgi:hypothetical protein